MLLLPTLRLIVLWQAAMRLASEGEEQKQDEYADLPEMEELVLKVLAWFKQPAKVEQN